MTSPQFSFHKYNSYVILLSLTMAVKLSNKHCSSLMVQSHFSSANGHHIQHLRLSEPKQTGLKTAQPGGGTCALCAYKQVLSPRACGRSRDQSGFIAGSCSSEHSRTQNMIPFVGQPKHPRFPVLRVWPPRLLSNLQYSSIQISSSVLLQKYALSNTKIRTNQEVSVDHALPGISTSHASITAVPSRHKGAETFLSSSYITAHAMPQHTVHLFVVILREA